MLHKIEFIQLNFKLTANEASIAPNMIYISIRIHFTTDDRREEDSLGI